MTPDEVLRTLEELERKGVVREESGFWQLSDEQPFLPERQRRFRLAIAKRKIAERGARLVARIPFVRFVGLVNTVAYESPSAASDIDLFIVTSPGRLWLTRALVTAAVHLRGWRRHGRKVSDRLCLSFFVTIRALNLGALKLPYDPYLAYWVAGVVPLWGAETYGSFMSLNTWAVERLPNRFALSLPYARLLGGEFFLKTFAERLLGGRIGNKLNSMSRMFQLHRHKRHVSSRLWQKSTAVVVTDDVMKFHETDQRETLAEAFRMRIASLYGS